VGSIIIEPGVLRLALAVIVVAVHYCGFAGMSRFVAMILGLATLPYIAATLSRKSKQIDRCLGDFACPVYLPLARHFTCKKI
jgi:hypothetical protein